MVGGGVNVCGGRPSGENERGSNGRWMGGCGVGEESVARLKVVRLGWSYLCVGGAGGPFIASSIEDGLARLDGRNAVDTGPAEGDDRRTIGATGAVDAILTAPAADPCDVAASLANGQVGDARPLEDAIDSWKELAGDPISPPSIASFGAATPPPPATLGPPVTIRIGLRSDGRGLSLRSIGPIRSCSITATAVGDFADPIATRDRVTGLACGPWAIDEAEVGLSASGLLVQPCCSGVWHMRWL